MISPVKIWRNQKKIREVLNQSGKIISFTRVFMPPAGFENQAPYAIVLVKLASDRNYIAQLVDFEEKHLKIGQKVITVLRRTRSPSEEGIIPYGVKFKPL